MGLMPISAFLGQFLFIIIKSRESEKETKTTVKICTFHLAN